MQKMLHALVACVATVATAMVAKKPRPIDMCNIFCKLGMSYVINRSRVKGSFPNSNFKLGKTVASLCQQENL